MDGSVIITSMTRTDEVPDEVSTLSRSRETSLSLIAPAQKQRIDAFAQILSLSSWRPRRACIQRLVHGVFEELEHLRLRVVELGLDDLVQVGVGLRLSVIAHVGIGLRMGRIRSPRPWGPLCGG